MIGSASGLQTTVVRRISVRERIVDALLIVAALPLLAPLGLAIALVVFLDSPGPVVYRTRRVGVRGQQFVMLKFRTMRGESTGPSLTCDGDVRITPIGQFLRSTRLDELPQIWNVLRGEMRLVGPRPELVEFTEQYRDQYREILSVPPGITGPTQVTFARSEGRLLTDKPDRSRFYAQHVLPRKIEIDLGYVRSHSAASDLLVLANTIWLPFKLAATTLFRSRRTAMVQFASVGAGAVLLLLLFFAEAGSPR